MNVREFASFSVLSVILLLFFVVMVVFVILFIAVIKKLNRKGERSYTESVYDYNPYHTATPQNSCPSCGYAIKPDFRICPQCGTPLQNQTIKQSEKQDSEKNNSFDC